MKSEEAKECILHWSFKIREKKWWKPAIIEKIMICHYVDRYLESREEELEIIAREQMIKFCKN